VGTILKQLPGHFKLLNEYRFTHPVWSTAWCALICFAALCALALASSLVDPWWSAPWNSVVATSKLLDRTTPVPNWLLTTWGIGTLLVLVLCGIAFRQTCDPRRHYTTDSFFGVKWRWEYDDEGKPRNLQSHCPHCYFDITNCFGMQWNDRYNPCSRCPGCEKTIQPLGDKYDVWAAVEHMIDKNIRSRDWSKSQKPITQAAVTGFDPRDGY
jgi:hypothetical protein